LVRSSEAYLCCTLFKTILYVPKRKRETRTTGRDSSYFSSCGGELLTGHLLFLSLAYPIMSFSRFSFLVRSNTWLRLTPTLCARSGAIGQNKRSIVMKVVIERRGGDNDLFPESFHSPSILSILAFFSFGRTHGWGLLSTRDCVQGRVTGNK